LRKLVGYYGRCPQIGLAAAAAGVSAPTVQAWRNRGASEGPGFGDGNSDKHLVLMHHTVGAQARRLAT
jgi:hypothetical protein